MDASRVAYITDIEGDLELWRRSIEYSEVLRFSEDDSIELTEGASFVYGGDVVDHKPGDLSILKDLVALKRRYPDRVNLLIGNRDANKLRLALELNDTFCTDWPLSKHPGVYWLGDTVAPSNRLSTDQIASNDVADRLRFILEHTMGAPNAFESRRKELGLQSGQATVSDSDVVRSFVEYAQPGGLLYDYLNYAELAVIVGTTLFVHAGLPRSGNTWMPGWMPPGPPTRHALPLREWVQALHEFKSVALQQVAAMNGEPNPETAWSMVGGYDHPQVGSSLMQYAMRDMPDGSRQPSVIYNGWLGDEYQPLEPDVATLGWLREGGVCRVVSGHLPHGDAPLVLRLTGGIVAITADISYAKDVTFISHHEADVEDASASNCQKAVCEVILGPAPDDCRTHGTLHNGLPYEADLSDLVIGNVSVDGWRVKARSGARLVLSRNKNWDFETKLMSVEDVAFATST